MSDTVCTVLTSARDASGHVSGTVRVTRTAKVYGFTLFANGECMLAHGTRSVPVTHLRDVRCYLRNRMAPVAPVEATAPEFFRLISRANVFRVVRRYMAAEKIPSVHGICPQGTTSARVEDVEFCNEDGSPLAPVEATAWGEGFTTDNTLTDAEDAAVDAGIAEQADGNRFAPVEVTAPWRVLFDFATRTCAATTLRAMVERRASSRKIQDYVASSVVAMYRGAVDHAATFLPIDTAKAGLELEAHFVGLKFAPVEASGLPDYTDADALRDYAVTTGGLYPIHTTMARADAPMTAWVAHVAVAVLAGYRREIDRAAIVTPATVGEAAAALREYYRDHVAEVLAVPPVAMVPQPAQQPQACAAPCGQSAPVEEITGCIHLPPEVLELRDRGALFVVNHSAGKDSQAMLLFLRRFIPRGQLLLIHADLGRVEWEGNVEHIQATCEGLPLITATARRDLLQMVRERFTNKPEVPCWPSPSNRQCTSDLKRGPIEREVRRYLKAHPEFNGLVVNCLGMRAQESSARAKLPVMKDSARNSKAGRKWLDFHPIHDWSVGKVWATIAGAGQEPHPIYGKGMSRLSCRFCIMASESDLTTAATLSPDLFREYCEIERDTGYTMSMSGRTLPEITGIDPWAQAPAMVPQVAQQPQAKARPDHAKAWEAQARAAGWVRDASGAWGRPGVSTLAGMVRQPAQSQQADAGASDETVTPRHASMVEICAAIARAGFTAYMRTPGDHYAFFRDGERVGYIEDGRGRGAVLSTCHVPNTTTGTGFTMAEGLNVRDLDRETLAVAFAAGPHWAYGAQLAASRKWPTFEAFRKSHAWGGGLKPVRVES